MSHNIFKHPAIAKTTIFLLCAVLITGGIVLAVRKTSNMEVKAYAFLPANGSRIKKNDLAVKDINKMGASLLQYEVGHNIIDKNVLVSPVSLATALAVLSHGAGGDTRGQIDSVLNSGSLSQNELCDKYNSIISKLQNRESLDLQMGNSVWIDKRYKYKNGFLKTANQKFDADMINTDFSKSYAVDQINKWAADKTHGLITKPIHSISPNTVMYIVNSLYFNGKWQHQFDTYLTKDENFICSNGQTVKTPMMNMQQNVLYYENDKYSAVNLPYNGSASMMFVLPKGSVDECIKQISASGLDSTYAGLQTSNVQMKIPKFKFSTDMKLNDYLNSIGLIKMFSTSADFSGISDRQLDLNQIHQNCVIDVNEDGTKAAAITAGNIVASAMPMKAKVFHLKRPFLFFIRDDITGSILFSGEIINPLLK